MNQRKLLYILPEYDFEGHTHFSYIPQLLREAGKVFTITLLVERGKVRELSGVSRIVSMPRTALFRMIQLPFAILSARLRGARVAYVHYSFMSAFWASLIFRLTGGSVFYWNCGLPWQYSRTLGRSLFEQLVYHMVTKVVTGTEGLADRYTKEYFLTRSNVEVMPNWIDIEETVRTASSMNEHDVRSKYNLHEGPYVLFAHRLSERKGAQYLPKIYSQLPSMSMLVVAGDGPLRSKIQRETTESGGKENVQFLGWVSHDEVLRLMLYASAYLMPSDEEGFPHVLLEAMALGTPFVATSVGGVPEIVPPGLVTHLHRKGDIDAMSDTVAQILFHTESKRGEFRNETKEWVTQYDVKLVARRFEAILAPCYSPRQ